MVNSFAIYPGIKSDNNEIKNQNSGKILKKRGRKPKNKIVENITVKDEIIDTEKEVIIAYLPINIKDIDDNNDSTDIFIKQESIINNTHHEINNDNSVSTEDVKDRSETIESDFRNNNGIYLNKINIYNIQFKYNTKCWWCKNSFNTPNVSLPEQYFDDTFFCIGNFCSYNCCKAYNIDLNDFNISKRDSLINLMYFLTYKRHKNIKPAPSWLILEEFGGYLSISEFRKNFDNNNNDYVLLHPPLISRQMQIEESYKKNDSTTSNTKIDKFFNNDYVLKRNKPVETSQLNLEITMGLKRKNK